MRVNEKMGKLDMCYPEKTGGVHLKTLLMWMKLNTNVVLADLNWTKLCSLKNAHWLKSQTLTKIIWHGPMD